MKNEPIAFFDPQEKGFYWAKPTKITAPTIVDVEPLALYTHPPQPTRNDVLEEVAREFDKMPFGDTSASFAVFVRNMKT
jgi:hypothetical protein